MASWSDAAHALPAPRQRQQPKPAQRRRRAPARKHGVAGGAVWIVLLAVLLAGVVALNVAVLRLNVELNKVNAERTKLRADKQEIASQLSLAAGSPRLQALAARGGLVAADPTQTTYIRLHPRAR